MFNNYVEFTCLVHKIPSVATDFSRANIGIKFTFFYYSLNHRSFRPTVPVPQPRILINLTHKILSTALFKVKPAHHVGFTKCSQCAEMKIFHVYCSTISEWLKYYVKYIIIFIARYNKLSHCCSKYILKQYYTIFYFYKSKSIFTLEQQHKISKNVLLFCKSVPT